MTTARHEISELLFTLEHIFCDLYGTSPSKCRTGIEVVVKIKELLNESKNQTD